MSTKGLPVALYYVLALLLLVLDLWTKALATEHLIYAEPVVLTNFFNLTLLHNPGAAFSFLSTAGGWQHWLFGGIASIISVVLVAWIYRAPATALLLKFSLALILAGALGNLWDRVTLGYVVDFIQWHYKDYYWPAFNIADAAISVGAVAMVIDSFRSSRRD
ncbi:MAG: lipoprotein signal peptidase [Porticoccaceae bacterium]|nr:lipoprotein signal peptidase [Porticoccaceae bacterium]